MVTTKNFIVKKLSLKLLESGNENDCEIVVTCVDFSTQDGVKHLAIDFCDLYRSDVISR